MSTKPPNVLIILADDVGTGEVPGYWNTGNVEMPNVQKLVDEGITFTDAHSTPLCSPSRYVLLSGNYQHRGYLVGSTWKMNYQSGQFRNGQLSLADVFKAGGYHTAMMGKWHLGGKSIQYFFERKDGNILLFLLRFASRIYIFPLKS